MKKESVLKCCKMLEDGGGGGVLSGDVIFAKIVIYLFSNLLLVLFNNAL